MKKVSFLIGLMGCFLWIQNGLFAQQNESFFYYYQGKSIPLEICTEQVLVKFKEDVSPAHKERLLGKHRVLDPSYIKEMAGVSVVYVWERSDPKDVLVTLRALQANPAVDYAHPFFWIPGADIPLSYRDDILLQVTSSTSAARLREIAAGFDLHVASTVDESLGLYQLKLNPRADSDAMQRANRLHELPDIVSAEPNLFGESPSCSWPN